MILKGFVLGFVVTAFTTLTAAPAHGFVSIRSNSTGNVVRWNRGSQLTFRANTRNNSGMNAQDILSTFTTSLNRWKQIAFGGFDFTYFQGADASRYPTSLGVGADNVIFFTSQAASQDKLSCGVIGLTQVWFDPGSGAETKADVRFNDDCYVFTNVSADTSSQSRIFLADVATHEFGHALGLDHSQVLQSSMVYTAAVEMNTPSCDDHAAMSSLYGGNANGQAATITGRVFAPSGSGIFGAHVQAISIDRGASVGSALTESDGSYTIRGLEAGQYTMLIEPYYPGASALGPYYRSMNSAVCASGRNFSRTFAVSDSNPGVLQTVSVGAGETRIFGSVTVNCTDVGSINSNLERNFNTAPTLPSMVTNSAVSTVGAFQTGSSGQYFAVTLPAGTTTLSATGYSIFSPVDLYIDVLDTSGRRISSQNILQNVFTSSTGSGYTNYDSQTTISLSTTQNVIVRVYSQAILGPSNFPSSSVGLNTVPFYLLSLSRGVTTLGSLYPSNARCANTDSFSAYVQTSDAPAIGGASSGVAKKSGSAGCGTIESSGDTSDNDPNALTRLLNFVLIVGFCLAVRTRLVLLRSM